MNILIATFAVIGTLTILPPDGSPPQHYSRGFDNLKECIEFNNDFYKTLDEEIKENSLLMCELND